MRISDWSSDVCSSDLHIGRTLPEGHPLTAYMAPNVWPLEIPGFREAFSELYQAFEKAGLRVLEAIALPLGLERDYFTATVADGNSVLRMLHYQPLRDAAPERAIRPHAPGELHPTTHLPGAAQDRNIRK